jgi:hypothetical protein
VSIGEWEWSAPVVHLDVSLPSSLRSLFRAYESAAAATFFTTYEFLKQQLPKRFSVFRENPSLNHLAGSTGGEFASRHLPLPNLYVAC